MPRVKPRATGWRTGTKNPLVLYYDDGVVSHSHGYIANPEVGRRIVELLNAAAASEGVPNDRERALSRWLGQPWEPPEPAEEDWHEHVSRAYRAGWNDSRASAGKKGGR
jgi:hypothetical protein